MTSLAQQLIEKNLKTKNPTLDLGNCGLKGTEPELELLAQCEHLETLIFSNEWWEYDEKEKKQLKKESQNIGRQNTLQQLPLDLPENLQKLVLAGHWNNRWEIQDMSFLEKLSQLQTLYLRSNQIQDYSFLEKLSQLQTLYLSSNQIQDIAVLEKLSNLQTLYLSYNQIQDIAVLEKLNQLQTLYLSSNQIQDISFLEKLNQLQTLYLSSNQIQDISLENFEELTEISLTNNPLESISLKNFPKIQRLNLSNLQQLKKVELKGLINLQTLDLSSNQIQDISFLEKLSQLQTLYLSSNQIQDYSFLEKLSQLQTLDLSSNQIQDISFLEKLSQLQTLDLSSNQIQDYSFLEKLSQLQTLDLSSNQIQDISFLEKLSQLQTLDLSSNQIQDYSFLEKLSQLQTLDLSSNQIQDYSFLEKLSQLQTLVLSSNQIQDYSFLEKLSQLQTLVLSSNQIQDYSFLEKLSQLQTLVLSSNQIQEFTLAFLNNFPKLDTLYFSHNPIQNIPQEIFDKEYQNVLEPVRNYLEDEVKGAIQNQQLKIILIGNGSVGKTQVAKRFSEGKDFIFNSQHDSTHAIARLEKEVHGVQLQIWDFAGQEIYHVTHRLFMQTSALFFLVWDFENEFEQSHHEWQGKKYKNEKLTYWLEYAQHFGKGSPIVVLQNKVDTETEQDKTFLAEDWERLQSQYPIVAHLQVSAKEGKNFKLLEHKLKKAFEENETLQQWLSQSLPIAWLKVRTAIEALQAKGEKTLNLEAFETLCEAQEVKKSANTILDYFHNVGVFYYRWGYFNNQIILNQDWAIQAIYKILDRESEYFEILADKKGHLEYEDLQVIWSDNTDDERKLFIDFMLSAELCFEATENKRYDTPLKERSFIVPHLLPERKSEQVDFYQVDLQIKKVQEYGFLPSVFIQRFIVRFSKVNYMWKQGLFLESQEGNAVVEANYESKSIVIFANTEEVIHKIQEELQEISHESHIKARNLTEEEAQSKQYFDFLKRKEEKGKENKKFGLQGLHPKINTTMNPNIQKALRALENANMSGYFSSMDKIEMPVDLKDFYGKHKKVFISGQAPFDFAEQLRVFADQLEAGLSDSNTSNPVVENSEKEASSKDSNVTIHFNPNIHVEGAKIKNAGNSTNTNTQSQSQSQNQSLNFEQLGQKLPDLQSELDFLKDELEAKTSEKAKELLAEVQKLLKNTEDIESLLEAKDEKKIKRAGFWKRLGAFGKTLLKIGVDIFTPDSIKNVGRLLSETAKIGDAAGINTGFDHQEYENWGSE